MDCVALHFHVLGGVTRRNGGRKAGAEGLEDLSLIPVGDLLGEGENMGDWVGEYVGVHAVMLKHDAKALQTPSPMVSCAFIKFREY